jgi:hypothetical protein
MKPLLSSNNKSRRCKLKLTKWLPTAHHKFLIEHR